MNSLRMPDPSQKSPTESHSSSSGECISSITQTRHVSVWPTAGTIKSVILRSKYINSFPDIKVSGRSLPQCGTSQFENNKPMVETGFFIHNKYIHNLLFKDGRNRHYHFGMPFPATAAKIQWAAPKYEVVCTERRMYVARQQFSHRHTLKWTRKYTQGGSCSWLQKPEEPLTWVLGLACTQ